MTTSERKFHAAAICREVQGHEDVEIDLGKKVSMPKDIMLEELSMSSNRGSRLFKMRQRRSEKYTFESIQNGTNMQHNGAPISLSVNEHNTEVHDSETNCTEEQPTDSITPPNPDSIAPGYGGPVKDVPPEKFNSIPKSYHSPWEQAIISDPALADTLTTRMPDPDLQPDRPVYKCFNRVATPFGGFGRTCSPIPPIQSLPVDLVLPDFPELQAQTSTSASSATLSRPSFNRAATGWVSSNPGPVPIISISQPDFIPESDDL